MLRFVSVLWLDACCGEWHGFIFWCLNVVYSLIVQELKPVSWQVMIETIKEYDLTSRARSVSIDLLLQSLAVVQSSTEGFWRTYCKSLGAWPFTNTIHTITFQEHKYQHSVCSRICIWFRNPLQNFRLLGLRIAACPDLCRVYVFAEVVRVELFHCAGKADIRTLEDLKLAACLPSPITHHPTLNYFCFLTSSTWAAISVSDITPGSSTNLSQQRYKVALMSPTLVSIYRCKRWRPYTIL